MRKKIFLAIVERLTAKVPELKFIDLWNEQLATLTSGRAFSLPAVFIEFEQYEVHQNALGVRMADVPVRLHIITRAKDYAGSADKRMAAALAYFDTIDAVNAAMQGLNGDGFSSFMLTASATNHNHAELVENIERWVTRAQDASGARKAAVKTIETLRIAEQS